MELAYPVGDKFCYRRLVPKQNQMSAVLSYYGPMTYEKSLA